MKKILIVNPFGIGDVLFTTPLIAVLKERYPQGSISYIGNARTAPFLKNDPRLDKVFSYERDEFIGVYKKSFWSFLLKWRAFLHEIRAEKFDMAFDLSMGAPVSLMLKLAGIPVRVGFDYKGRGRWLTHKVPLKGYEGRHVAEYVLDLMVFCDVKGGALNGGLARLEPLWGEAGRGGERQEPLPSSAASQDPMTERVLRLCVTDNDQAWTAKFMTEHGLKAKSFIIIYPGGGASWGKGAGMKRWPAQQYAKLAEKIIERSKCPIILMGDKTEEALCQAVAKDISGRVIVLAGKTSLLESSALMRQANFVLANDGGPLHMAVASGVRTVSVFGPVDPAVYGPYPSEGHKIVVKGLPCQPCYRNFRMSGCGHQSCLRTLTVNEVFSVLEEWL